MRWVLVAAVLALVVVPLPAWAAGGSSWQLVASGTGIGEGAVATASVPGLQGEKVNHRSLRYVVTTKPASLRVDVSWDFDCGLNHQGGGKTYTGSFVKVFASAPGCAGDVTGDLGDGAGTVTVAIYAR